MTRPRHLAEFVGLRLIDALANVLPYRGALAVGWGLAAAGFPAARRRVNVEHRIRELLGEALPDRDVHRIAWLAWRNFIFCGIDLLRLRRVTMAWIERHVEGHAEAVAKLTNHARTGRGAILACPHMGAWELAGVVVQRAGLPVFFLTGRQKNPLSDAYLNRRRGQTGIETVPRGSPMMRTVLRRLKEGGMLGFLPDVRVPTSRLPPIQFFGRPAHVVGGMAVFARQGNVPIFPSIATRRGWSRHVIRVEDPVWPDPSLPKEEDFPRLTQEVFLRLEAAIRAHPEQWFWYNKRWILDPVG